MRLSTQYKYRQYALVEFARIAKRNLKTLSQKKALAVFCQSLGFVLPILVLMVTSTSGSYGSHWPIYTSVTMVFFGLIIVIQNHLLLSIINSVKQVSTEVDEAVVFDPQKEAPDRGERRKP